MARPTLGVVGQTAPRAPSALLSGPLPTRQLPLPVGGEGTRCYGGGFLDVPSCAQPPSICLRANRRQDPNHHPPSLRLPPRPQPHGLHHALLYWPCPWPRLQDAAATPMKTSGGPDYWARVRLPGELGACGIGATAAGKGSPKPPGAPTCWKTRNPCLGSRDRHRTSTR
jgi:hypothetical protein